MGMQSSLEGTAVTSGRNSNVVVSSGSSVSRLIVEVNGLIPGRLFFDDAHVAASQVDDLAVHAAQMEKA